jgi:hypothetical protein
VQTGLSENGFGEKTNKEQFLLSNVNKEQWINLTFMDKIISRNEIKLQDFDEEANAIPFFMDFGDSLLKQIKDELDGKFIQSKNKESKIIKKRDENEFLDESVNDLEKLLHQIPSHFLKLDETKQTQMERTCLSLFESLKTVSSFEIDHFFKKETMFDAENCIRFLKMFNTLFSTHSKDFDFKCVLLKTFLEGAADQLISQTKENPLSKRHLTPLLKNIEKVLLQCQQDNEQSFRESLVILQELVNKP